MILNHDTLPLEIDSTKVLKPSDSTCSNPHCSSDLCNSEQCNSEQCNSEQCSRAGCVFMTDGKCTRATQTKSTLRDLQPGQSGIVSFVCPRDINLSQKLLSMGFTQGVTIEVISVAPLGDPIKIRIRGCLVSLRKGEASCVEIA